MPTGAPVTPDQIAAATAEAQATIAALCPTAPPATPDATPATAAPIVEYATDNAGNPIANPIQLAAGIDNLRQFGLDPGDEALLATGRPLEVSAEVRAKAETTKSRLMADRGWVAKYLAGDVAAQALMMACNMRIGAATLREG